MASPVSFVHKALQSYLQTVLTLFVDEHGLGQVLGANAAYRLSGDNVFQPDISFIRAEGLHLAQIDPIDEKGRLLGLAEGQLSPVPPEEGVHGSRVLPGFWLRTGWLFPPEGRARPSARPDCLVW